MPRGKHPNELQQARDAAMLTRQQLADKCERAAEANPETMVGISVRGLERLEAGEVKPRMRTAVTLAHVLGFKADEVFISRYADYSRNPEGKNKSSQE